MGTVARIGEDEFVILLPLPETDVGFLITAKSFL